MSRLCQPLPLTGPLPPETPQRSKAKAVHRGTLHETRNRHVNTVFRGGKRASGASHQEACHRRNQTRRHPYNPSAVRARHLPLSSRSAPPPRARCPFSPRSLPRSASLSSDSSYPHFSQSVDTRSASTHAGVVAIQYFPALRRLCSLIGYKLIYPIRLVLGRRSATCRCCG